MSSTQLLNVVFIGSGNVATHLAKAFHVAGHRVLQVYSRSIRNAELLGNSFSAAFTDNLKEINCSADLYVFATKDDALPQIIEQMPETSGIWVHTSGSISIDVLACRGKNYGVFYPLQTFSKGRELNFAGIPIFVEGDNPKVVRFLQGIGQSISSKVGILSSEKREYLHLAAVFACNFTNHMYVLASEILEREGITFDVLHSLISETASKATIMSPTDAQTGPAVRFDKAVMQNHLQLLSDENQRKIYTLLSENIHKFAKLK